MKLKKNDKKGKELEKNVFEIVLKEDFLDIFLRADYEQLFAPDTKRRNHLLQKIEKETLKRKNSKILNGSPSKRDIKELFKAEEESTKEPLKTAAMQSLNTHGGAWSNRQGVWPLSERRLIFTCKKDIVSRQWVANFN